MYQHIFITKQGGKILEVESDYSSKFDDREAAENWLFEKFYRHTGGKKLLNYPRGMAHQEYVGTLVIDPEVEFEDWSSEMERRLNYNEVA